MDCCSGILPRALPGGFKAFIQSSKTKTDVPLAAVRLMGSDTEAAKEALGPGK